MRKLIYKIQFLIYPLILWYYRKPRVITKRGIKLWLNESVFHPSFYLSTDLLLDYVISHKLDGKKILELGCGSGFISLYLAKNYRVEMFASDINPKAIKGIIKNAKTNNLTIDIYESDLFSNIPALDFDFILVNPPYFKAPVKSLNQYAFYTGENHEYFLNFFRQIKTYIKKDTKVILILSENVKLHEIKKIASTNFLKLNADQSVIKFGERFDLFILESALDKIKC